MHSQNLFKMRKYVSRNWCPKGAASSCAFTWSLARARLFLNHTWTPHVNMKLPPCHKCKSDWPNCHIAQIWGKLEEKCKKKKVRRNKDWKVFQSHRLRKTFFPINSSLTFSLKTCLKSHISCTGRSMQPTGLCNVYSGH